MDEFTLEFIAEQLALAAKATPRPWAKLYEFNIAGASGNRSVAACGGYSQYPHQELAHNENTANTDYIIAAANNYPAALEEIARLREAQRWIPVGERLPELGVWVIVQCAVGRKSVWRRFESFESSWQNETGVTFSLRRVTHWMPLPESPQEDKGD